MEDELFEGTAKSMEDIFAEESCNVEVVWQHCYTDYRLVCVLPCLLKVS